MLKNPVYVQADLDVYDFFKNHGADVVNEVADFAGINGCYFYTGRGREQTFQFERSYPCYRTPWGACIFWFMACLSKKDDEQHGISGATHSKIEEPDTKRQSLTKTIVDMRTSALSSEHAESISGYLTNWADVNLKDRRLVVDGLISRIQATSENVLIEWKVWCYNANISQGGICCTLYNDVDWILN